MKKLLGKTALITGAGRGIGRATASLFAANGANVVLISRTESELRQTEALCKEKNPNGRQLTVPLDLTNHSQIDHLFEELADQSLQIDVLVNDASIFLSRPIDAISMEDFRFVIETNLVASLYLSQKVIPSMRYRGGGTIVNVSSLSGCFGTEKFPGFGAYNISKYGLWGLTEILALENEKFKIRVNQISFSGVDTAMFRQAAPPGVKPKITPEDAALQILYLASDESFPLTGHNLIVTGISQNGGLRD